MRIRRSVNPVLHPAGRRIFACAPVLLLIQAGCAGWSYDLVQIGMRQDQCRGKLAEDTFRRTDLGYCYFREQPEQVEAVVILIGRDGQVAGKLHVRRINPGAWFRGPGSFRLRGELDVQRCVLDATGPIDALRAIADDLLGYHGTRPVAQAHAWVAAGLVRLMERWPHVGAQAAGYPQLTEVLERVPGGGVASVRINRQQVYSLEYTQDIPP